MKLQSNALPIFLASSVANYFVAGEDATEYHTRLEGLLTDVFEKQDEATAWWVGFSHPTHGDHYWVFGNSSDTDETYPPDISATIDDHFYIGSISKTFGATVNLQLIEQGLFALNQTLESIIPDFSSKYPQYANYTPADLMGMQTLVPDFLNDPNGMMKNFIEDPSVRYSISEIIDAAMTQYPVTFPYPDFNLTEQFGLEEYFEYSTTNILAMEYLAENVTGKSMQDLVQELVLSPLELKNTAEPPRDAAAGTVVPDPASTSYIGQGCVNEFAAVGAADIALHYRNDEFSDSIVNTGTGGAIYSTIQDLLQWAKSGVGDSLLSPETVTARREFKPTSLIISYGLGMHVIPLKEDFGLWYGHDGDAFNSNARAAKSDEHGISFASAENTCGYEGLHDDGMTVLVGDYLWYVAPGETNGSTEMPGEIDGSTVEPAGSDGATTSPTTSTDSAGVMPKSASTLPLVVALFALLFAYSD